MICLSVYKMDLSWLQYKKAIKDIDISEYEKRMKKEKKLFPHQCCEIWAMKRLEDNNWIPKLTKYQQNVNIISANTTIGVLSSSPGSGKSLTILALVLGNSVINEEKNNFGKQIIKESYLSNQVNIILEKEIFELPISLLVIPSSLFNQWKIYIQNDVNTKEIPKISIYGRFLEKEMEDFNDIIQMKKETKLIIMKTNAYEDYIRKKFVKKFKYQRFILDEADTIKIPLFEAPPCNMTWLISASSDMLLSKKGVSCRLLHVDFHNTEMFKQLYIKSSPAFIQESMKLPEIKTNFVKMEMIHALRMIRDYIPQRAQAALDAGDIQSVMEIIDCNVVQDEECLVKSVTEHLYKQIASIDRLLAENPMETITSLTTRRNNISNSIKSIKDRIVLADVCPISLDPIRHKTITPCCKSSFELESITRAIGTSRKCPMCRQILTLDKLIVLTQQSTEKNTKKEEEPKNKQEMLCKIVKDIINENPHAQILVFSEHTFSYKTLMNEKSIYHDMTSILGEDAVAELKGNSNIINARLQCFQKRLPMPKKRTPLKMLLLNPLQFGAGLDMSSTTHMITLHAMPKDRMSQIIGRAQRFGRKTPLSVTHIRYNHESNN